MTDTMPPIFREMQSYLTLEKAIELGQSPWWEELGAKEVAFLQLQQNRLCMPFGVFHQKVEEALGHPVFTHEFAHVRHLLDELLKDGPVPLRGLGIRYFCDGCKSVTSFGYSGPEADGCAHCGCGAESICIYTPDLSSSEAPPNGPSAS